MLAVRLAVLGSCILALVLSEVHYDTHHAAVNNQTGQQQQAQSHKIVEEREAHAQERQILRILAQWDLLLLYVLEATRTDHVVSKVFWLFAVIEVGRHAHFDGLAVVLGHQPVRGHAVVVVMAQIAHFSNRNRYMLNFL